MMHKLRAVMGKRDDLYTLCNSIEIDEGFFEAQVAIFKKPKVKNLKTKTLKKKKEGGGAVNNPRFWLW